LPASIDEVIRRGMAKQPTQRYATCRELIAAARQALTQPVRRPPAVPVGPRGVQQSAPYPRQQSTPPSGYQRPPVSPSEPVRLRPPAPAGSSSAFTSSDSSGGSRWIAPVLVGIVAIGLIVAAIVLLSSAEDPGTNPDDGGQTTTTTTTTLSSIKVGDEPTETSGR
jgi:hypothetical protein